MTVHDVVANYASVDVLPEDTIQANTTYTAFYDD